MKPINLVEFTLVFQSEASGHFGRNPNSAVVPGIGRLTKSIDRLTKLAATLERLNLNACNYGLTPRQENRREAVESELGIICKEWGIEAVTQGDPRGAAFGIVCKHTGNYNSLGGHESGFRLIFEGK